MVIMELFKANLGHVRNTQFGFLQKKKMFWNIPPRILIHASMQLLSRAIGNPNKGLWVHSTSRHVTSK